MQSMMANATAFTPSKKKKRKVTIAESKDDVENNFQINNEDVEGCDSDDEEMRVAMCKILGGMSLSSKKNDRHKALKCTNDNKLDDKLNEKFYLYTSTNDEVSEPPTQKTKKNHKTTEIVVEMRFKDGSVHLLRTLLDSGTSATMLLRKHVELGRISKYKGNPVKWTTLGGVYTIKREAVMEF
jgi:hypothetical protein